MDPLQSVPFNTPSVTPPSTLKAAKMQTKLPETPRNLNDLVWLHAIPTTRLILTQAGSSPPPVSNTSKIHMANSA